MRFKIWQGAIILSAAGILLVFGVVARQLPEQTTPVRSGNMGDELPWITYRSAEFGFSLEHPGDWTQEVLDEGHVKFSDENRLRLEISRYGNPPDLSGVEDPEEVIREAFSYLAGSFGGYTGVQEIAGRTAWTWGKGDVEIYNGYIFKHGGEYFQLLLYADRSGKRILTTLEFDIE